MPLKLTDNTKLTTANTGIMTNASPVSFSIWIRLDRYDYWSDDGMGRTLGCGDLMHSNLMIHNSVQGRWVIHSGTTNDTGYIGTQSLILGVVYHVAFTVANGEQKLYLNGALISTATAAGVDGFSGDSNSYQFEVSCPDGVTYVLQEPVVWVGYKLTAADALALRDGAAPTSISSSNIKWHLTLAGSNGATATVGDAGLADQSSSGLNVTSVGKHGGGTPTVAPTYEGTALTYTPPAKVSSAFITPSRQGLALFFSDRNGVTSNLAALSTNPTLTTSSLNGGNPLSLTNAIWGATQPAYSPFVYYPLPGTVSSGDSPHISAPEMWASAVVGEVEPLSSFAVDNSGKAILPPFNKVPKTMRIAYNTGGPTAYWSVLSQYSNFAKRIQFWDGASAGLDSNGYPNPTGTGGPSTCIVVQADDNTVDSKKVLSAPTGTYTVMWDGPGLNPQDSTKPYIILNNGGEPATTIGSPTLVIVAPVGQTQANNKITQVVSQDQSVRWSPAIYLKVNANPFNVPFTNLRIFPPGLDENSPTFHPTFLEQLGNTKAIRVMAPGGGDASIVDFSDWHPDNYVGYLLSDRWPGGNVVSVGPTSADIQKYFPNVASALITFSSPHGYKSGYKAIPNVPGPLPCVDGTGVGAFPTNVGGGSAQIDWGFYPIVIVIDSLNLAVPCGGNSTVTCTLNQTYYAPTPHPTDGSWSFSGEAAASPIPPGQNADLANAVGCDLYFSMPPTATDACVTSTINLIASRLAPHKKLYLEYGNEVWNWTAPGSTNGWCNIKGHYEGMYYLDWYTKRMGQVHTLAYNALAALGRGGDLIRVLGAQSANPGGTTGVCGSYANANGIPIDAVAIAPYFENCDVLSPNRTGEWSQAGCFDACGPDQIMDLAELFQVYGHIFDEVAGHFSYCGPGKLLPNAKLICYEGGPEQGILVTNLSGKQANDRKQIWSRHPRFRNIMLHYLENLQNNGVDTFFDFLVGCGSEFAGGWAWNVYYTYCMKAGMGDGSDGQYDNRTSFASYPTIHWDYANLVSVIGGAINYWNSLIGKKVPNRSELNGPVFDGGDLNSFHDTKAMNKPDFNQVLFCDR